MPEGKAREDDVSLGGEPFLDSQEVCVSLSHIYRLRAWKCRI